MGKVTPEDDGFWLKLIASDYMYVRSLRYIHTLIYESKFIYVENMQV